MIARQVSGWFRLRWMRLVVVAAALGSVEAAATEWFLKIDGLSPERTEPSLPGWIVVLDVGARVQLPLDPTNQTPGAPVFACQIRKGIDSLSPLLLQSCASGQVHRRLNLVCAPTNGVQYRLALDAVRIGSIRHQTSTNAPAREPEELVLVQFSSGNIEMSRVDVDGDGGVTGGLTAVFDPSTGDGTLKPRLPFRATITHEKGRAGVLVHWPAEKGHRYRIQSRAAFDQPWRSVVTYTGLEDGIASQFVATPTPALFLRVEEVD